MEWENELEGYLRMSRRIKQVFSATGLFVIAMGGLYVYLNFENYCIEVFGRIPTESVLATFLYFMVAYIIAGIGLITTGIIIERKLNLEKVYNYALLLFSMPLIYALSKFILEVKLSVFVDRYRLTGMVFLSLLLLSGLLLGRRFSLNNPRGL